MLRRIPNYEMQVTDRYSKIRVQILLFASLREITGREQLEVELSPPENTIECALKSVCASYSHIQELLVTEQISVALNQRYLSRIDFPTHFLHEGDIIALLPPISGG
jgi:MoaD family protein